MHHGIGHMAGVPPVYPTILPLGYPTPMYPTPVYPTPWDTLLPDTLPPLRYPTPLTSGGHHWRPVQTCLLEAHPHQC